MERILPPGGLGQNVGAGGGNAHILNARFLRAENDRLTRQLVEAQAELAALKAAMVKPLQWRKDGIASSQVGHYTVWESLSKTWWRLAVPSKEINVGRFATEEAAKAAAQADYTARILSAITLPPEEQEG